MIKLIALLGIIVFGYCMITTAAIHTYIEREINSGILVNMTMEELSNISIDRRDT
jgi:hypothetical protein